MTKRMRSQLVLALVVAVAGSVGFAQAGGEAVYKANCQSCHGSAGTPNPGIAKSMGVKPANDPDYKKTTEADMIAVISALFDAPDIEAAAREFTSLFKAQPAGALHVRP